MKLAGALVVCLLALPALAQFTPSDDAYVNAASATTNFGKAGTLNLESGSQTSFIRFDLTAVPTGYTGSQVAKATLKLYVNALTTPGSFNVDLVAGTWNERTITYNLQPAITSTLASSVPLNVASRQTYVEIDVTSTVQAWLNGTEPNDGIALVANSPLVTTLRKRKHYHQSLSRTRHCFPGQWGARSARARRTKGTTRSGGTHWSNRAGRSTRSTRTHRSGGRREPRQLVTEHAV